ncbi:aldose 1-epimerase [Rhodoferax sp. GW822-FHT02A01]|uniref:aldose 1-epimerase n=1 Tax=Rhodoferax sp. GW822-FHT02A01 TaxID=3141537 RepID=UPI00315C68E4
MTETITLRASTMRCEIVPALGGSLAGLWFGEHEVLRHQPAAQMQSGLDGASYPLVPYSNRVGYRQLRWDGHDYVLAPNFPQEPHCIHGVGWMRAWDAERMSASQARLTYHHVADDYWPFAFETEQVFTLDAHTLEMHISITNRAAKAVPAGLGWHPYFAKSAQTHVRFSSNSRWEMGADMLPTHALAHSGLDTDCANLTVDHCFEGWAGALQLQSGPLRVEVSSDLSRLVVFTTPARDSIAIEPVSHVNNALSLAEQGEATLEALGMQVLQPGQSMRATMRIRVEEVV